MSWIDDTARDFRVGARNLAKHPGFTAIAVLSLALGVMATTAMYSVIYGVVLHPFPYRDVDSLTSILVRNPEGRGGRTYYTTDQFLEIRDRSTIFEGVIASTISDVLWTGAGEPQRLRGNHVTPDTFELMGVPPLIGRYAMPSDGAPGAEPVVVLGHRFWMRQFGGDSGVLGRRMQLDGTARIVIGVMPKRFMWRGADVYVPVVYRRGQVVEGVRSVHVLGRLKPGVNQAQAEADLRPIIEELKRREPSEFPEQFRVNLLSFKETFPSGIREALWILFGAVGLLLLIACANVSNLQLSRASSRQNEMAVRAALGASRSRLLRQLLAESVLLALLGGSLGVALAYGGMKAIIAIVPLGTIPDESEIVINLPVLAFSLAISIATVVLFGLAPALHTATRDLANPLRESGRASTGGARQASLRSALVVTEVALSLVLLAGATLMIRTLIAMQSVDFGIRMDRLLTMRIPLPEKSYATPERRAAFYRDLLERVRATPDVVAAGLNTGLHPLGNMGTPVELSGAAAQDSRPSLIHQVNPDYLKTLGIPLLQGRLFDDTEMASRRHVAVVNQAFTRRYAGGESVIGRVLRVPRIKAPPLNIADDTFLIIGMVKDTVNRSLQNEILPEVYMPYTIAGMADRLVILTRNDPASVAGAIRAQVLAIDKNQPVTDVRTVGELLDQVVFSEARFNLALFSVFAALGLALAVIGVYGVVSNSVAQRRHEIGVRIALGAGFGTILRMVLADGFRLVALGMTLGVGAGLAGARLLASQVWRVSPLDPVTFALSALVLLLVGMQACFWPARRAARVDPVAALRHE